MKTHIIQSVPLSEVFEKYYVDYREQRVREFIQTRHAWETEETQYDTLEKVMELDSYESIFDIAIEKVMIQGNQVYRNMPGSDHKKIVDQLRYSLSYYIN